MPHHSKRLAAEPGEPLDSVADVGDRHEDEEGGGPHASPGGPRRKVGAGARAVLVHKVVDDDDGLRDADDEQGLTPRQALDHATKRPGRSDRREEGRREPFSMAFSRNALRGGPQY